MGAKVKTSTKELEDKVETISEAESKDGDEYFEQRDKKLSLGSPTSKKKEL